jgi:sugar/nucleoside kinase (ribokinase family)
MKFDVIGFGALNVDRLCHVNRIACGGEESFILNISEAAGGSAANTIVGIARLGLKTGFIGKVADDHEGQLLLNDFRKEGVDTEGITVVRQGHSGNVTAFVDRTGERALYVHPSVNDTMTLKDIDIEYAKHTQFMHLASMDEKPFQAQKQLVEMLHEVKMTLDPGEIYARKGLAKLAPILRRCYVFMPSENELRMLTGKHFRRGAGVILKYGAGIVAVKLGRKGCYVTDGKENHLIEPSEAKPIDKTGAGDAFCAGFLYGLVKKKDLYECGRLGNFVASKCIEHIGARAGLPRASDCEDI